MTEVSVLEAKWMQDGAGDWLCLRVPTALSAMDVVDELQPGKEYRAQIKRKGRSLDANAYCWVLMDKLAAHYGATKEGIYQEEIRQIAGVSDIVCVQGNAIDRADTAGCNGKGWREDVSYTLNTIDRPAVCAGFKLGNSEQARSIGYAEEQAPTLNAECGGNKPAVLCLNDQGGNVMGVSHDVSGTLRAQEHGHQPSILDMSHACDVVRDCGEVAPSLQARMGTGGNQIPLTYQMQGFGDYREGDVASSCKQRDFKDSTDLVCSVDCRNFTEGGEINGTLQAKESGGQSLNLNNTVRQNMVVRRLTPLECERLQGFPDGWTDIGDWVKTCKRGRKIKVKGSADSPRYKALGNSIALPFWDFLAKRISAQYLRPVTMGSLFDGIGGFPLVFERHNGKGTARWASEIEEFPIAVTKLRFGEDRSVTAQRNCHNNAITTL